MPDEVPLHHRCIGAIADALGQHPHQAVAAADKSANTLLAYTSDLQL